MAELISYWDRDVQYDKYEIRQLFQTSNFYAIDVLQVSIESSAIANEYDDVAVDPGFPILKDMFFDEDERHLYVLTPNKVRQAIQWNQAIILYIIVFP